MKTKIKLMSALTFIAMTGMGQQLQNTANNTANQNDAVLVKGSTTNQPAGFTVQRLGHLESGTYGSGWGTWASLGRILASSSPNIPPNDVKLYGLTVHNDGDRAFFGTKRDNSNRVDAVVAWGDDNNVAGAGPDRLKFEFHDSNSGSSNTLFDAMTLVPNGTQGVYVGINMTSPTEQLHTNKGVRFQGLVNGAVTDLVGIDANGKLWRTPVPTGGGGSTLGNYCSAAPQPLTAAYEIPMSGNDFHFTGDQPMQDKVYVGPSCTAPVMKGKLNVLTAQPSDPSSPGDSYAIYGENNNNMIGRTSTGVYGTAVIPPGNGGSMQVGRGVWGYAEGEADARGVFGQGGKSSHSYGGYFESTLKNNYNYGSFAEATNANLENYGVTGKASASQLNIGVSGYGYSSSAGTISYPPTSNIGVYGNSDPRTPGSSNWAGYFDGDTYTNGTVYAVNPLFNGSDRRFKQNIKKLNHINESLSQISGYTYEFKTEEFANKNFDQDEQIGLIAQEVKEIFPQLVKTDKDGYLAVNYQGMIPVLLEAIKEQQQQINELKTLVQSIAGNSAASKNATGIAVNLSDKNTVILDQNTPNPFAESTVISYNVPTDFTRAQIIFTSSEGRIIKSVDITAKGPGSLNVFANDLTHGIYSYSLIIDGKVIDTKKMIKE